MTLIHRVNALDLVQLGGQGHGQRFKAMRQRQD